MRYEGKCKQKNASFESVPIRLNMYSLLFMTGAAVGYMLGHGGTGMLSGIDGGPRMAIGGNYVGL